MKLAAHNAFLAVMLACVTTAPAWAAEPTTSSRVKTSRYPLSSAPAPLTPSRPTAQVETEKPVQSEPVATPQPSPAPITESADFLSELNGAEMACDDGCACDAYCRHGLWYGGVDYLLVRPRFSQAAAEVRQTFTADDSVTPAVAHETDNTIQFPFKYQSSFRAFLGYRLLDCGGDLQFAFWRLTGSAQLSDGPATGTTGDRVIYGQLNNNPAEGQFFSASAGVTANLYDVDFAKFLAFGGPKQPCDACFCPRWDLRWSVGARAADVSRYDNNATIDPNGNIFSTGNINARFVGAGPRIGFQGRRYFGQCGMLALYGRASQALLIGDYKMGRSLTIPGSGEVATSVLTQHDTFARLVPVTDIEVGGSWQLAPYAFISAGWFFQCWWDLGQSETISSSGLAFGPLDTANILGFDGLFVRGELLF